MNYVVFQLSTHNIQVASICSMFQGPKQIDSNDESKITHPDQHFTSELLSSCLEVH